MEFESNGYKFLWKNSAGEMWSLQLIDGVLWTSSDFSNGVQKLFFILDTNGQITSFYCDGKLYVKVN